MTGSGAQPRWATRTTGREPRGDATQATSGRPSPYVATAS